MRFHATAILSSLAAWLFSPTALAFEEQWHVGGGIGAVSASESRLGLGPAVNLYGAYGLDDMFDVKLDFAASSHAFEAAPGTTDRRSIYMGALGISYKIDVIEWIPYFGVQLGWLHTDLPEDLDMGTSGWLVGGMLGLDYAVSSSWGVGVVNQYHMPLEGGGLVGLFLRSEYRWDHP
ncbi:MAG TPA: outer membrane beta-barrel protein [Polyangiaceae bacterium]